MELSSLPRGLTGTVLAGKYASEDGSTECTPCDAGSHQDEEGGTACDLCAPGKSAPEDGLTVCTDCERGRYQEEEGRLSCDPCSPGTSSPLRGSVNCGSCPDGFAAPGAGSIVCIKLECNLGFVNGSFIEDNNTFCMPCSGLYQFVAEFAKENDTVTGTACTSCFWDPLSHNFNVSSIFPCWVVTSAIALMVLMLPCAIGYGVHEYQSNSKQSSPAAEEDGREHDEPVFWAPKASHSVVETQQEDTPADQAREAPDSLVQQQNVRAVPRSPEAPRRADVQDVAAEQEVLLQRVPNQVAPSCCVSFLKSFWLVVVIVVSQFFVPVIAYFTQHEWPIDQWSPPTECSSACDGCALQNSLDKWSLEYAVSSRLGSDSDFPFYEVGTDGTCTNRTKEIPTGYVLKDECEPSYVVRDSMSCDNASKFLEQQGFHVQVDFLMYAKCVVLSPYSPDVGIGNLNLEVCFDHQRGMRSFIVLAAALLFALPFFFRTPKPPRIEDDEPSIQAVSEGAWRAASRAVRKGPLPLMFRIAQITWVIGGASKCLRELRPWCVAVLYLVLFFPWIRQYLYRPVLWMIPYKGSPFRASTLSRMTRLHFFMSVLPLVLCEAIKISRPQAINISGLNFPVLNHTPQLLRAHQPYLLWFGETLTFLTMFGGLIYVPCALGLAAGCQRCFVSSPDNEPRIKKLAEDIERAAFDRLQAVRNDPSWKEAYQYMHMPWWSRCLFLSPPKPDPDWPENAQPRGMWKWDKVPICGCQLPAMPGDVLTALVVFFLDVATDTWAWYTLITVGHSQFGGLLAWVSWTSTLVQVKKRYWKRLIPMSVESMAVGVETEELLGLLDTERGLETLVSLIVQVYGFNFAPLENTWNLALAIFSILISLYSLAKYTTDIVDHGKDSEENSDDLC